MKSEILNIQSKREFFWDNYITDSTKTTAELLTHKPAFREAAIHHNEPWERTSVSYRNIININGTYRMYYIAGVAKDNVRDIKLCCAESSDGITWTKPNLGLREYKGSFDNNIILDESDYSLLDNFYLFYDTTENGAKFKGISAKYNFAEGKSELWYWTSDDGYKFELGEKITDKGAFDTLNTIHWDPEKERYVCYIRGFHNKDTGEVYQNGNRDTDGESIRDIRVLYSKNFKDWTDPELLKITDAYGNPSDDYPLYTNNAEPYYRGKHITVAIPTRYIENKQWDDNFERLCGKELRQKKMEMYSKRAGLAVTDCVFMLSRDDENWVRYDDAFITPGPEHNDGWIYGDCYPSMGFIETPGNLPGSDNLLAVYNGIAYDNGAYEVTYRYSMRIDGYVSRHAGYNPQKVVTKQFIFSGDTLEMNFSTSAMGYIRITITDEDGHQIKSCSLFGDKIDRIIDFDGNLTDFAGKAVVMEIEMSDADVYSFRFFNK